MYLRLSEIPKIKVREMLIRQVKKTLKKVNVKSSRRQLGWILRGAPMGKLMDNFKNKLGGV